MWQSMHQFPPKSSNTFLCCLTAVARALRMSCTAFASALYNCGLGWAGACSGTRLNCAEEIAVKSMEAISVPRGRLVIHLILIDQKVRVRFTYCASRSIWATRHGHTPRRETLDQNNCT